MELVLNNIRKVFGNKTVIDGVCATLQPGITGLLGANGTGKTTLMRIICGVLKPTDGTVFADGISVTEEAYRDALGYLPQDFGYYPSFSGRDFLMYMSALKGLCKPEAKRKSEELLAKVNLSECADKKIKTYSGGMKRRLGIAQALLNDPRILVLDEPTAGLDPAERVRFRDMLCGVAKESTVLLSTHIVSDVENVADRILIMKDGRLIRDIFKENIPGKLEDFYMNCFAGGENE